MDRTKSLVLGLLLVAAIVGLEEWRLAGSRKQISQLEQALEKAEAEKAPPPRPAPPGEDPEKLLSRTKSHRSAETKPETAPAGASEPEPATGELAANVTPEAVPDAAPEPEPAAADTAPPEPKPNSVRTRANQALRNSIVKQYANLIDKFQFNNVEAGYFVDLLVEDVLNRQQFATELASAQTDEERAAVQARARQTINDMAARMRDFLGNDQDFAIFQEYRRLLQQAAAQGGN